MIYKTLSLSLLLSSACLIFADDVLVSSANLPEVTASVDTPVALSEITEEQQPSFELPADQEFRSYYNALSPEQQKECVRFGEELTATLSKSVEKLQDLINQCDALQKTRSAGPKGGSIKIQVASKGEAAPTLATVEEVINDAMNSDLTVEAKSELKGLLEQAIELCNEADKDVQQVADSHPSFKSKYTEGLSVSLLVASPTNVYVLKA